MSLLLEPIRIGPFALRNRVVMAPMQRARNDAERVPTDIMCQYYVQRASMGLLISEASSVSPISVGRPGAAAIFRDAQAAGWSRVAAAVHAAGATMFQQLYHLGRKSDPSRMPAGETPVSASAVPAKGQVNGVNGPVEFATPRPLATDEVAGVVAQFRAAARNARAAGMDGIEIHGANGYLIMQFLCDVTNKRTDRYGGSIANRVRFLQEIVAAITEEVGKDRLGVRISPHFRTDGIGDSDAPALFLHVAAMLKEQGVAYLHVIEADHPGTGQSPPDGMRRLAPELRRAFGGPTIVNGGYTLESAERALAAGAADAVSFAALAIANPDLPDRLRRSAGLNKPDQATFYDGGAKGYIDYPALAPA
ncbi:MAG TPA: alkene reductase [Stellaceae bacterium]|nr:alkene reductase [Stellaceae bacterium]